ncbi:D-alanyl-D-alanine carboxypeptidase family protein [uncultured Clostridium sp.]|uniref:D-alanyl-D-alanine carboxypeptidase family protein n=1 Tax=uncultured Clostridium sp. TaxID=59620 RepID=UPI0028E8B923|nr:D-alanyl-D-alanine carboxypeptidase family protein [uncultured Clostridium sp.]
MDNRFKKFIVSFSLMFFFLLSVNWNNVYAYSAVEPKNKNLKINSLAYIALDCNSRIVLAEKNSEIIVPMASTTKIITALIALDYGDLDKEVEISSRAAGIRGSTVGYRKGEKITIKELTYGLMLRSGNDAAIAIAEGISGTVEDFAKLMNEYASKIGLIDTHFHSPHGLDDPEHYSTAYDLAILTSESKKHPLFDKIVSAKDVDGKEHGFTRSYHNINKILWQIPEANGVKTGYTGGAGKCLVTSVKFDSSDVVIVVLNSPDRWNDTAKINKYVKDNYEYKKFYSKGDKVGVAPQERGKVNLVCDDDIVIPIRKDKDYSTVIKVPQYIKHNIYKGDKVGSIYIFEGDKLIYKKPLESDKYYKVGLIDRIMMRNKK